MAKKNKNSLKPRVVHSHNPELNSSFFYAPNKVRTTKYTIFSFLPKNLFEQFRRLANSYFLAICIILLLPGVNPVPPITSILPLALVITISAVREAFEDYARGKADKRENNRLVTVLRARSVEQSAESVQIPCKDVQVGDLVVIHEAEPFPADMLLLRSPLPGNTCYIETANLDGETDFKRRNAPPSVASIDITHPACSVTVGCSRPDPSLYEFGARLTTHDGTVTPVNQDSLLLRGAILRNTDFAVGLVLFTGPDTKLVLNTKPAPSKFSHVEIVLNKFVVGMILLVIGTSLISGVGGVLWELANGSKYPYLFIHLDVSSSLRAAAEDTLTFFILYNIMIPISLYVSIEMVKLVQASLIQFDIEMYDEDSGQCAVPRTSNLLEELGQVQHVFCDKTGTLTENIMVFRKCAVNGMVLDLVDSLTGEDGQECSLSPPPEGLFDSADSSDEHTLLTGSSTHPTLPTAPHTSSLAHSHSSSALYAKATTPPAPSPHALEETLAYSCTTNPLLPLSLSHCIRSALYTAITQLKHSLPSFTPATADPPAVPPHLLFGATLHQGPPALALVLAMVTCHNVQIRNKNGVRLLQAMSPDEEALVHACDLCGVTLTETGPSTYTILLTPFEGVAAKTVVHILNVFGFDSDRKRMSVILQWGEGRVLVVTKGADSTVLPLVSGAMSSLPSKSDLQSQKSDLKSKQAGTAVGSSGVDGAVFAQDSLTQFACQGLRTLVFAIREVEEECFRDWETRYNAHMSSLMAQDSQDAAPCQALATAALVAEMESCLSLIGVSGVEDKLQQGVPETLSALLTAGVRVWVLTGDKTETALNIAYSSGLFSQRMKVVTVTIPNTASLARKARRLVIQRVLKRALDEIDEAKILSQDEEEPITPTTSTPTTSTTHPRPYPHPSSSPSASSPPLALSTATATGGSGGHINAADEDLLSVDPTGNGGAGHEDSPPLTSARNPDIALVVDGPALAVILESQRELFLRVAMAAKAVLCCRTSPIQKAQVVRAVKHHRPLLTSSLENDGRDTYSWSRTKPRHKSFCFGSPPAEYGPAPITLAIGDGANDVSMLQEAHVGVGIQGREGSQAFQAADYAISQFRFLARLLLVHGRYSYIRTTKLIMYSFYKNIVFTLPQLYFASLSGWSAQSVYDTMVLLVYNMVFTAFPVLMHGAFEKDVEPEILLALPQLYRRSRENTDFNTKTFITWVACMFYHSAVLFIGTYLFFGLSSSPDGKTAGLYATGAVMVFVDILIVSGKMLIETCSWNVFFLLSLFLSVAVTFVVELLYSSIYFEGWTISYGLWEFVVQQPAFYLSLVPTVLFALLPDLITKAYISLFSPRDWVRARTYRQKGPRESHRSQQLSVSRSENFHYTRLA